LSDSLQKPIAFTLQYKLPNEKETNEITEEPAVQLQLLTQVNKCYQFASAVVMFGSMLRHSPLCKEVTWNQLLELSTAAIDPNDKLQKEFVTLVQQAKTLYSKKRKKEN
jgi:Ca-activated chloride channel homolog